MKKDHEFRWFLIQYRHILLIVVLSASTDIYQYLPHITLWIYVYIIDIPCHRMSGYTDTIYYTVFSSKVFLSFLTVEILTIYYGTMCIYQHLPTVTLQAHMQLIYTDNLDICRYYIEYYILNKQYCNDESTVWSCPNNIPRSSFLLLSHRNSCILFTFLPGIHPNILNYVVMPLNSCH